MKSQIWFHAVSLCGSIAACTPLAVDDKHNVTYTGLERNEIEAFLNIPYGEDTGGQNRFKPPKPHIPASGSTIEATSYGPSCPQQIDASSAVTNISEDCLNLNVVRPRGANSSNSLPVMVYIYGGSFFEGNNQDPMTDPDGLVLESVKNGLPVLHVAMNYRLGSFGFAKSGALNTEGSENAGLRDQRLAIDWVRDNIEYFGGDPEKITIFGQSSGGLSVGMQIMAYGASKPVPFQQGICESQVLEAGITGNFTIDAMQALVDYLGCNSTGLHSEDTISCLRKLDTWTLLNASLETYQSDVSHNIGDIWLPSVDGDFLPAAPSELIRQGRFANVTTMIGWCQDDVSIFTDFDIQTPKDTFDFISSAVPDMTTDNVNKLLSLYPVTDFPTDGPSSFSSEFQRTAHIFRDIVMTCQPMFYGQHLADAGNDVFFYDWNQTILDPCLLGVNTNKTGLGVVHTSELAYVFDNLSYYTDVGCAVSPTPADYALADRGSRSWSTYASVGRPSLAGHDTFQGFETAFRDKKDVYIFVAGGPHEGLSAIDGPNAKDVVREQKLRERCGFLNSPEIIEQLRY